MKKMIDRILAILLLVCLVFSCPIPTKADPASRQTEPVRILLVGNSLTGRHCLSGMLARIAGSKGQKVQVTTLAKGGCNLRKFATDGTRMNRRLRRLLSRQSWDYVVYQDRHAYPVLYIGDMCRATEKLCRMARKAGAQPMLYMTWAPEKGHRDYRRMSGLVSGRADYQEKIAASYEYISSHTNAPVIPVGYAFLNAGRSASDIRLLSSDKYHPSRYGSYLTACTMYSALFQETPEVSSSGSDDLSRLQRIAWSTWRHYQNSRP
ncbi:MAG: hypothetical protein Q4D55_01090 [Eubacteriales bacterium]|nr:hypothetical protein [Eubacteriales bacterium]